MVVGFADRVWLEHCLALASEAFHFAFAYPAPLEPRSTCSQLPATSPEGAWQVVVAFEGPYY